MATAVGTPQRGDLCLSIQQPWASLIMDGVRVLENRSWKTLHRGRLWIHASNASLAPAPGIDLPDPLPRGALVGSVQLVAIHALEGLPEDLSKRWDAKGPLCWVLADPQPLLAPLRCHGSTRLWHWTRC
jgi:activating signal cointegrator 1